MKLYSLTPTEYTELTDKIADLEAENARLRELACWQEDDAEPVTVEWLHSQFKSFTAKQCMARWNVREDLEVIQATGGPFSIYGHAKGVLLKTRGQLRRLVAALEGK